MDWLFLIGRIVFGAFFINSGVNHFLSFGDMRGYAESKGVPSPAVTVAATGVILVAGGLAVLLGVLAEIGLALLVGFLVVSAVVMHDFWAVPEERKAAEKINFFKNLGLAGAALMLLYFTGEPWPLSLGG